MSKLFTFTYNIDLVVFSPEVYAGAVLKSSSGSGLLLIKDSVIDCVMLF